MIYRESLLKKIIPPATREEREGFTNDHIISQLSEDDLRIVEERLIDMLKTNDDYLIAKTLVHLDSKDSVNVMQNRLKLADSPSSKIKWASYINHLKNGDKEMESIAYNEFEKFEFIYEVEAIIFDDLIKFNSQRINNLIRKYIDHKYYLVAYHAKRVLNL